MFPNIFREFPKIPEDVRRFPKIPEDFRGRSEDVSVIHQQNLSTIKETKLISEKLSISSHVKLS